MRMLSLLKPDEQKSFHIVSILKTDIQTERNMILCRK
jgi:hypothetical protein